MPTWRAQLAYHAPDGESVAKGDVVVRFDASEVEARLRDIEEEVATADSEMRRAKILLKVELATARSKEKAANSSYQIARMEAAVPAAFTGVAEHERRKIVAHSARATLADAIEAVRHVIAKQRELTLTSKARLDHLLMLRSSVTRNLEGLEIRAEHDGSFSVAHHPFQGTKFTVGETLRSGTVVGSVAGTGGTRVKAWIHEADRHRVSPESVAKVRIDAYPGLEFAAKLTEIGAALEPRASWGNAAYHAGVLTWLDRMPADVRLISGMSVVVIFAEQVNGK